MGGCFDTGSEPEEDEEVEESSSSGSKSDRDAMRQELSELRARKKELEGQLAGLEKDLKKKDELVATELKAAGELEAARTYAANLGELEKSLDTQLGAWRDATRRSFIGVTLPEIVTVSGTRYESVVIAGVTDTELLIQHAAGQATIPILDLPLTLRKNVIHEGTVLSEINP